MTDASAKRREILTNLCAKLIAKGADAKLESAMLMVDGINCGDFIEIKARFADVGGWNRRPTGEYHVNVGYYWSDRKMFRESKVNGFRYDDMADAVLRTVAQKKRDERAEQRTRANDQIRASFEKDVMGGNQLSGLAVYATSYAEMPLRVRFERTLTLEQARMLYEKMVEIGLVGGSNT